MVMARVTIDLDVFEDEDLREEMEERGYTVLAEGETITNRAESLDENLDRIEHLLNCGFPEQARAELLDAASRVLGRPL